MIDAVQIVAKLIVVCAVLIAVCAVLYELRGKIRAAFGALADRIKRNLR